MSQPGVLMALSLTVLLAGCAGSGANPTTEIPVACVTGFKSGRCAPGKGRYYYDYGTNRCRPTSGRGCGSRRLFKSLGECASFCGAPKR